MDWIISRLFQNPNWYHLVYFTELVVSPGPTSIIISQCGVTIQKSISLVLPVESHVLVCVVPRVVLSILTIWSNLCPLDEHWQTRTFKKLNWVGHIMPLNTPDGTRTHLPSWENDQQSFVRWSTTVDQMLLYHYILNNKKKHIGVSKNRGTPKSSILIGFSWVFHYKPSILGYPYFWKHPYIRAFHAQGTSTWPQNWGRINFFSGLRRIFFNRNADPNPGLCCHKQKSASKVNLGNFDWGTLPGSQSPSLAWLCDRERVGWTRHRHPRKDTFLQKHRHKPGKKNWKGFQATFHISYPWCDDAY